MTLSDGTFNNSVQSRVIICLWFNQIAELSRAELRFSAIHWQNRNHIIFDYTDHPAHKNPSAKSLNLILIWYNIHVNTCNSHASFNTWVTHNVTAACVWLALLGPRFSLGNSVGGDEGHQFGKTSEVTVTWSFSCIGIFLRMQWDNRATW